MRKQPTFFQDTGRLARPFEGQAHIEVDLGDDSLVADAAFCQRVRSKVRWFVLMKAASEEGSFTT
jgi:hypothetical protein